MLLHPSELSCIIYAQLDVLRTAPARPGPSCARGLSVKERILISEHYYTNQPTTAHDESSFTTTLRGRSFAFTTDAGVFSRDRVDFGSLLLIEAMEIGPAERVLDLGCGYGPVGASAAVLAPEGKVYLVDVNERAAALARRNLAANGITNAEVRTGDALESVQGLTFHTILTNPPIRAGKETIYRMVDQAYEALEPGGSLWVVIQKKQGAPSMKRKLEERFGQVEDVDRKAGYHVFRARK